MKHSITFFLLLICSVTVLGQTPAVNVPLTVTDNGGGTQILYFGLDPSATDGVDIGLGEAPLPPLPPAGIFDARFNLNATDASLKDYRNGTATFVGEKIHEVQYQVGTGTTITIAWDLPAGITGRLQDVVLGTIIDVAMSGNSNYTVANPAVFNKLKMTVTYNLLPPPAQPILSSPANNSTGVVLSPTLIWFASSGATKYTVQLATDSLFTALIVNDTNVVDTSKQVGPLNANTKYFWRVLAASATGQSAYSSTFNFTTQAVIGWCNLQWPATATISQGSSVDIYAQVWADGITNGAGQGAGITASIGYSTADTDPSTWTNWAAATYNTDSGNNDEYMASIGNTLSPGTYYYASKFELNGVTYYGGYNSGGGGFWNGTTNVSGTLTINPNLLSGDYYVGLPGTGPGGSNPQFASLKAACDTLNTGVVGGNCTFYITSNLTEASNVSLGFNPAPYTVTFKPYTGTNDTITFTQPADNVGVSGGWVFGTPTLSVTSATNYGLVTTNNITIDGSNTVGGTTRNLVIQTAAGISGSTNPIRIIGDVNNCTIKNVAVLANQSVSYAVSITNRFFTPNSWTPDSITVDNCDITNTISASGQTLAISNSGTPTTFPTGMVFKNNDILARTRGIFLNYAGNTDVYNNRININQTSTGLMSYGIWGYTIGDTSNVTNIYNNQITLLSSANANTGDYGIVGIEAGSKGTYNIYNNMISGFSPTSVTADPNIKMIGIRSQAALVKANIFFNSIYLPNTTIVPGVGVQLYAGIYISNGTNVVKNNIVVSDEDDFASYGIYRNGTNGTLVSDYNDFFYSNAANGNVGYWNAAATKTLTDWQTASSQDANSLNVVAPFTSVTDLHIPATTVTQLESAGTPIAGITTDIDGQTRNVSTPDIGADEFAGLLPLASPTNLLAVSNQIKKVNLSWMDNTSTETGFVVERKTGDSTSVAVYSVIATLAANSISYLDTLVQDTTLYTYRVKAVQNSVSSPYSNQATVMTLIPVELTSFVAQASDNSINISWITSTEKNNRGFDIERKLDNGWEKIGYKEGKGTSLEISNYTFTDEFKYKSFKGTVQYRLKQIDFDGTYIYSHVASVDVDFTPKEYSLYQNYPNPFNPSTTIKFALPFESKVRVNIYSITGELVEEIVNTVHAAGVYDVQFNAGRLASGMYIYSIDAQSLDGSKKFNNVKKMMLVK